MHVLISRNWKKWVKININETLKRNWLTQAKAKINGIVKNKWVERINTCKTLLLQMNETGQPLAVWVNTGNGSRKKWKLEWGRFHRGKSTQDLPLNRDTHKTSNSTSFKNIILVLWEFHTNYFNHYPTPLRSTPRPCIPTQLHVLSRSL